MQIIFTILICLCLIGCSDGSIYKKKNQIENENWTYSQILSYSWAIKDTADWYNIALKIEHVPTLLYRNVYVKCITRFPDNSKKEQLLSLELFDEGGKPFGKCTSSHCTTDIPLIANTKFPFPGDYILAIELFGRDSFLIGLKSFEIEIIKAVQAQ